MVSTKRAAKKPARERDVVYFSMEYSSGSGSDWTQRKASVLNDHRSTGFVLYTSTNGLNHEPRRFADMGEAVMAGMAFAQVGAAK